MSKINKNKFKKISPTYSEANTDGNQIYFDGYNRIYISCSKAEDLLEFIKQKNIQYQQLKMT